MGEPVTEVAPAASEGISPFTWFGVALLIGAIWALAMGLEYFNTPTFTSAALSSILGVAIAVVAFLVIGWKAPANE